MVHDLVALVLEVTVEVTWQNSRDGNQDGNDNFLRVIIMVMVMVMLWHLYSAFSIRSNPLYNTLRGTSTRLH